MLPAKRTFYLADNSSVDSAGAGYDALNRRAGGIAAPGRVARQAMR